MSVANAAEADCVRRRLSGKQDRNSDSIQLAPPVTVLTFSSGYGGLRYGPDLDSQDRMIRFDDDPATSASPMDPLPTYQPVVEELTPAQLEAINRALDEAMADARRLYSGLAPPSV